MTTTPNRLFAAETIGKYLTETLEQMKTSIAHLNTVDDLDQKAEGIRSRSQVEHCVLRRAEAKIDFKEVAGGVLVEVTIPIEGTARLLQLGPNGYGGRPSVQGKVYARRSAWRLIEDGAPEDSVTLFNTFATAPDSEELREWANEQISTIEQVLASHHAEVEAHNARAAAQGDQLIAARRKLLVNTESLRSEFGTGI